MITVKEQKELGKKIRRETISRKGLADWTPVVGRDEAKALITEEEQGRIQSLLPLRHERMLATPFTFFRGAAVVQAHDLSKSPYTDLVVQACGDAHISNFGFFASPERRLVFDINDFDETLPAPFECDVKRLFASVEICGRDRGFSVQQREEAVYETARTYRKAMRKFSDMGNLDVWYAHLDVDKVMKNNALDAGEKQIKTLKKVTDKARSKNSERAVRKLTEEVDGKLRIISNPPIVVPLRELVGEEKKTYDFHYNIKEALKLYQQSLPLERRGIIDQYEPVDMARKVVGVGSVGTRAWMIVLEGSTKDDPLVLQIKEAGSSALERYYKKSAFAESGRRVVEGQRAIQTVGDVLLGWISFSAEEGTVGDYYVRQLWDSKGSFDLDTIEAKGLRSLGSLCAWTLAHAHAKTGNRHIIAGYLGKGEAFERGMVSYAKAYADQNEADYEVCCREWKR